MTSHLHTPPTLTSNVAIVLHLSINKIHSLSTTSTLMTIYTLVLHVYKVDHRVREFFGSYRANDS